MTFKIGDRVRVSNPLPENVHWRDTEGTATSRFEERTGPRILIRSKDGEIDTAFHPLELSPVRKKTKESSTR